MLFQSVYQNDLISVSIHSPSINFVLSAAILNIQRRGHGNWLHFKLRLLSTSEFCKSGSGVYIYLHLIHSRGTDPVSELKHGPPDDHQEYPTFLKCKRQIADEELLYYNPLLPHSGALSIINNLEVELHRAIYSQDILSLPVFCKLNGLADFSVSCDLGGATL